MADLPEVKRRVPKCRVLVGWGEAKMVTPVTCDLAAMYIQKPYELAVCLSHKRTNATKDLTLVPSNQDEPLIGSGKGSRYVIIGR